MASDKPIVIALSGTGVYTGLEKLTPRATIYQAMFDNPDHAIETLRAHTSARAVLVADGDIVKSTYSRVTRELVEYARRGGVVVLGGFFSGTVRPKNFDVWMQNVWGLRWKTGQYERTTVVLKPGARGPGIRGDNWKDGMASEYSSKAVFLKGVEPQDVWYAAPEGSSSESMVFGPVAVNAEPSVVFAKYGDGWLGYTGDVIGEDATGRAVLAMMGLDPRIPFIRPKYS